MTTRYRFYVFCRSNHIQSTLSQFIPPASFTLVKKNLSSTPVFHFQSKNENNHGSFNNQSNHKLKYYTLGLLTASAFTYYTYKKCVVFAKQDADSKPEGKLPGQYIPSLPTYKESEVAAHSTEEKRIWVTYKNGVYDITDFVPQHPGRNKILMAAGSSIEPYWSLYAVHHTQEVYELLEQYRIGNVDVCETKVVEAVDDFYSNEPKRHQALKATSLKPYNAEPPPSLLIDNFYTPNPLFYVRNHLPVPEVDITNYRLEIEGLGVKSRKFTLDEIKKFPKHSVTSAVQCAGNRRLEMNKIKPLKGLSWAHAAIGNATWTGARLIDVLQACGLKTNQADIKHIQFEGLDKGPDNTCYGASIPSDQVFDPKGEVILAYEMNGEELPRDHGYPLRVIVPGIVGARNVKWVSKIIVSDKESDSHWQKNDYKGFSPSTDWDTVDFSKAPAIQELPVTSAICVPEDGETVEVQGGYISVKGYAWSGGGRGIVRVDVTLDEGKTWHVADLEQLETEGTKHWAWTLWTAVVPVPKDQKKIQIWVKAVDTSYNTQPENFENIWNLRGVLGNAYHKIKITLDHS